MMFHESYLLKWILCFKKHFRTNKFEDKKELQLYYLCNCLYIYIYNTLPRHWILQKHNAYQLHATRNGFKLALWSNTHILIFFVGNQTIKKIFCGWWIQEGEQWKPHDNNKWSDACDLFSFIFVLIFLFYLFFLFQIGLSTVCTFLYALFFFYQK